MKYESKFGIGEIVVTRKKRLGDRIIQDLIGEVFSVQFLRGSCMVFVRVTDGQLLPFREDELENDPEYDQERGCYHEEGK